jgi:hypothetical protein
MPSAWTLDRIFTAAAPEHRRHLPINLSQDQLARVTDSRGRSRLSLVYGGVSGRAGQRDRFRPCREAPYSTPERVGGNR